MKHGAMRSPKLLELMELLDVSRVHAVGLLELLWHFVTENAKQGDVGKWSDSAIARAIDWTGDATLLINSLVAARWVDRDPEHRLLIHDWTDHAPDFLRRQLVRAGTPILTSLSPDNGGPVADQRSDNGGPVADQRSDNGGPVADSCAQARTQIHTKPYLGKPKLATTAIQEPIRQVPLRPKRRGRRHLVCLSNVNGSEPDGTGPRSVDGLTQEQLARFEAARQKAARDEPPATVGELAGDLARSSLDGEL